MDLPRNHESTVRRRSPQAKKIRLVSWLRIFVAALSAATWIVVPRAQTDLDGLIRDVLAHRDDNWRKLQQYVLDEHEAIDLRGPTRLPMWGERRDYTWYIRDGFFVRSPVKANGAAVPEDERRKYEADFLKRQQAREVRGQRGSVSIGPSGLTIETPDRDPAPDEAPLNVDGILKQTRQPQFISSAYFLRFKFEEGKYALVGRETLDGRNTLRIEYYPTRLFGGTDRRRSGRREPSPEDLARDAEFRRLMNKVALVTLWVEPSAKQIVKYTFNNVGLDFLPAQWLVHVDDATASMTMSQPFADKTDVWLPRALEMVIGVTMATGQFDVRYALDYTDYRIPQVSSKLKVKEQH
jgi:hypothetical protein